MLSRRVIVGVMGGSTVSADTLDLAEAVGRSIAEAQAILLCGGGDGVMEAAARGARDAGGPTIGIRPGPAGSGVNRYVECPVFTGLADARNYVNVRLADAVIALEGGPGTLSEIGLALKVGRPVVLAHPWRFLVESGFCRAPWADRADRLVALALETLPRDEDARIARGLDYPAFSGQAEQAAAVERYVLARSWEGDAGPQQDGKREARAASQRGRSPSGRRA